MNVIRVRKGRDIKLKGAASKEILPAALPPKVAVQPPDLCGLKLRPLVKEGDTVQVGSPLLEDKVHPEIKVVSPASGRITALARGEKRALLAIVIEPDTRQESIAFSSYLPERINQLSRQEIISRLLEAGVWPCLRQRPFSKIAHPQDKPKAIFVQAMNSEPLALDTDAVLSGREREFITGLNILKNLTTGKVHICCSENAKFPSLTQPAGNPQIEYHFFSGPHPAGNVSTHIHYVDPIRKGEIVWYVCAQDVLRVAVLFLKGIFSPERVVAVTGEGAANRVCRRTIIGASLAHLLEGKVPAGMRFISGSVLTGKDVGPGGFLRFYDSQITVIPQGGQREFLGWLWPGLRKYSFSKTFVSSFLPEAEVSLDTDKHGSDRAIVLNHVFDEYVPLDIMTFFLLKAVLAGDIEEAEKLGILECDEEDFALCSFACPSKTDVGAIIREGLELIEKEG